jgi:hypothetical protein
LPTLSELAPWTICPRSGSTTFTALVTGHRFETHDAVGRNTRKNARGDQSDRLPAAFTRWRRNQLHSTLHFHHSNS